MHHKSITLGQFVPANSIFHSADPRTKILWTIAMMVLILLCNTLVQYVVCILFVAVSVIVSKISIKTVLGSLKPVFFLLAFTIIFNLLFYHGETVLFSLGKLNVYYESVIFSVKMIIRVCLLVISAALLTFTTSPVSITDGIEALLKPLAKIGFPAHEFAMMMSIALRFIPTFADETDKIIKAQASRGADFESRNVIKAAKSYIPVLVPLFIGAFRSAEDMAVAMEARSYRGGDGRTKYRILKFSSADLVILIATAVFTAAVALLKVFGI